MSSVSIPEEQYLTENKYEWLSIVSINSEIEEKSAHSSFFSLDPKCDLYTKEEMERSTPSLAGSIENVARYSKMESQQASIIPQDPQIPVRFRQIDIPYVPLVSDLQKESILMKYSSSSATPLEHSSWGNFHAQSKKEPGSLSPERVSAVDRSMPPVEETMKAVIEKNAWEDVQSNGYIKPVGIRMVDTKRLKGRELTIDEILEVEELRNKNRQQVRHKRREERKKSASQKTKTSIIESVPVQVSEEEYAQEKTLIVTSPTPKSPTLRKVDSVTSELKASNSRREKIDKMSGLRRSTFPVISMA